MKVVALLGFDFFEACALLSQEIEESIIFIFLKLKHI